MNEPSSSTLDAIAKPNCAQSNTMRRSWVSITNPMPSAPRIIGPSCTSPRNPTAAGEPVSWYTCTSSATRAIWVPVWEIISPVHSSRKSREARSGDRSTLTRPTRAANARRREGGAGSSMSVTRARHSRARNNTDADGLLIPTSPLDFGVAST